VTCPWTAPVLCQVVSRRGKVKGVADLLEMAELASPPGSVLGWSHVSLSVSRRSTIRWLSRQRPPSKSGVK
jgi:hypothetical protein